ncbi:phosphatase PAP2 family protein [bacterium]|nr:phosphatase PAP2 family protein [bacterium]
MSGILALDTRLFVLLNQKWTSPFLDVVMPFVTDFDHWRLPLILLLLLALARGKTEARVGILFAILAVALADQICSTGVKPLFERPRPFRELEGVRQLVGAHDWSFPSSHAANTFAAGVFLALRFARFRWILVLPVLVAYSRVYVGVHYPLDVLAGALLGGAIGAGFAVVERVSRIRVERWLSFGRGGGDSDADDGTDEAGDEAAGDASRDDPPDRSA